MFARLFDSPVHLTILIVLIVILFGWKRLPDAARSVGRSMRIFKSEVSHLKSDSTPADGKEAQADERHNGDVRPSLTENVTASPLPSATQRDEPDKEQGLHSYEKDAGVSRQHLP